MKWKVEGMDPLYFLVFLKNENKNQGSILSIPSTPSTLQRRRIKNKKVMPGFR